jgi:hypothetical protein
VIDFGDALSGSLFYELTALYFNLLRGSPGAGAFCRPTGRTQSAWRDFVPGPRPLPAAPF